MPVRELRPPLFEEGDYEVHLDYAINDKKGLDSKTYYRTSF